MIAEYSDSPKDRSEVMDSTTLTRRFFPFFNGKNLLVSGHTQKTFLLYKPLRFSLINRTNEVVNTYFCGQIIESILETDWTHHSRIKWQVI